DDVDDLAATTAAELDGTRGEGEERVVAATADVQARVEVRAALADDDLTGADDLAAEALDTEALGVRVATVARGTRAFLVCHGGTCFPAEECREEELLDQELLDLGDLETRQLLTVSLALAVPGLV